MKNISKQYPFFLIVDDGGFSYALPQKKEGKIEMDVYYNILKLAKDFNVKIPICFTMKYLDKENISGVGEPLEYLDELMVFLKQNNKHIEIGYHGLTHENENGGVAEFYSFDNNAPIPEEIQRSHIEKSREIFDYWGLKFPELFVPPYYVWEEGVTDRILSEYGVKYLVSYKKVKFGGHKYQWRKSRYLEFYPRFGFGIISSDYNLNSSTTRQVKFFSQKTLINLAKSHIVPQKLFNRLRFRKSIFNRPVHSYMTHIGNFFGGESVKFWFEIFDWAQKNKNLHLCQSNKEAIKLYSKIEA